MSIGKFKKDELRSIADELKLVVPDNAKVLDLRELIQESEIYKNDKETYQAIVDCVLEEINDRRNENENRLEIEKIKLSQLEKELEITKLHNQSGKSLPLQNENQLITTECNIETGQGVCRPQPNSSRSVLNPLADVFGGPGGSNCVVPPQDLLISFRSNKIAVLADVEKAFLQISLAPKDKDVVRFLIDDGENGVQVYRFNRVLFGVNASPFLLAATIKTHIGKYMEKYPDTVRTLDHCFYVDDLVTGEDDAKSAFDLSSKAAKIMSEAGMNLRKGISNDCELMKQWQLEHFDHLNMNDFVNHPHRVLGLLWHPQKDYLSLRLTSLLDFLQKERTLNDFC
ncbi:integrase catalytic domain-containing protein [Trichonephila clavipes]|nr:integrase catalytic domain-containing protein [Trichonephila clavipes]